MSLLFTYGTLKAGFSNFSYWMDDEAVTFVSNARTVEPFHMWVTGVDEKGVWTGHFAPWLTRKGPQGSTGRAIAGEVYRVREDRLRQLDILESKYDRVPIDVILSKTGEKVSSYIYVGKNVAVEKSVSIPVYYPDRRYVPPQFRKSKAAAELIVPIPKLKRPRVRLVITADDFGVNRQRTLGILEGAKRGAITNAQLIVNGECPKLAADGAKALPNLSVGLHINLTEGVPLTGVNTTLVDPATGRLRGKFGVREALCDGSIRLDDVVAEVKAQLVQFEALMGYKARHADGHHHIHVHPILVECVAHVLKEQGVVSVRRCCNPPTYREALTDPFHLEVEQNSHAALPIFHSLGLRTTDGFLGMSYMGFSNNLNRMCDMLTYTAAAAYRAQSFWVFEFMTHSGYAAVPPTGPYDPFHFDEFSLSSERHYELALFAVSEWITMLRHHQVPRINMKEAMAIGGSRL